MAEPAIKAINQHTQKTSLNWLFNILVQPSSGVGSGVDPATHEQFGMSLDLIRQALVEITNVVNNLTTTVPGKVLDARQGKVLADTIQAEIAKYAQPNGIATLGSDGKVPASQIPSLALVDVFTVESEAAMLASGAEQGDMAIRTDSNQVFILSASPASTLENWIELAALKALVDSALDAIKGDGWDGQTIKGNADAIAAEIAKYGAANGIATLDATGKIPAAQLPTTAMEYKGSWDASSEAYPTTPDTGDFWLVSVAGTTEGEEFDTGDAIIYNGATWDKINKIEIAEEVSLTSDLYTATDVKSALEEIAGAGRTTETVKGNADAIATLETAVDTNRLYSDSQYLELKSKADAMNLEIQASRAELYNGYPILQFGSTDIIGKGTKADYSAIDVSANVVDGKLDMEQKGLTITNLVDGANIADSGTVSFNTVNGDKYFDTLNETIITGDGTEMSATNSSGATANMGIYHLNAHGLQAITDTDILAKLLPYVDGTKNVGKMGVRVVGDNLFDGEHELGDISSVGGLEPSTTRIRTGKISIKANTQYTLKNLDYRPVVFEYDADDVFIKYTAAGMNGKAIIFTTTQNTDHIRFRYDTNQIDMQTETMLNIGSSALPYEPYQEQLIFLPAIGNSLPNGTADSIKTVADGWEYTKRVYTPEAVGSGVAVNTTNYPTAKNGGQWVNELTAGGTEIGVVGTDSTAGTGMLRFELATPIVTEYNLPHLTSGKTIHRFAGEEKIALYGTGIEFSENVLTVLSAIKFVAGVMTDITDLATITTNTVTFSGVNATDVVYVKVEHDVDRPLGILEHTPAVSNTASRLAAIEAWIAAQEEA